MAKNFKFGIIGGGIAIVITAIALVVLSSDSEPESVVDKTIQDEKITVFASFYPYYEFTKNVVGGKADVKQYLPPGIEAHDWEPRAGEIQALQNADVFVYNGLGMEPFVKNIIESGDFEHIVFVKASKDVNLLESEEISDEDTDEGHENEFEYDPHIWLDPILVKQQVNNIRDGLVQADPINAQYYEENAKAYNAKLDALDAKIRSELVNCKKDTVVPFHQAFTYFGERYGLKIFSIGGIAPKAEASTSEIAEFIDFVKDNDIKVIFAEELVDPRLAEVIANEAGAQVLIFSPIEALTPQEASAGVTFLDKMEQNLDALKVALECQ